ncbi:MAG: MraY family glycosyltransferase [Pseudomonadota bacterium]
MATTFCIGLTVLYYMDLVQGLEPMNFMAFTGLAALVAVVFFVDDLRDLSAMVKLALQTLTAVAFVATVAHVERLWIPGYGLIEFGALGPLLTILWIVGFMNTLNCLDGVNGLASGGTLIASLILGTIAYHTDGMLVLLLCALLFASTLGFFVFNFPAGRIFMGDVGSQFIGFVFACVAVFGANLEVGRISFYVVPILFYGFIFDFMMTFILRLLRRKDVFSAHREHLFQICDRLGVSNTFVCLIYLCFFILNGLVAVVAQFSEPWYRLLLVLGLFPVYAIYGIYVYRLALRHGLFQTTTARSGNS